MGIAELAIILAIALLIFRLPKLARRLVRKVWRRRQGGLYQDGRKAPAVLHRRK